MLLRFPFHSVSFILFPSSTWLLFSPPQLSFPLFIPIHPSSSFPVLPIITPVLFPIYSSSSFHTFYCFTSFIPFLFVQFICCLYSIWTGYLHLLFVFLSQDVQTIDIDYMLRFRDFTIDPDGWGDLPALAQELHNDDVKLTLILVSSLWLTLWRITYLMTGG